GRHCSVRQLRARLLCHHVRRVPRGPVLVPLAELGLVRAMGMLRAPKRARQIAHRRERRRREIDPTLEPLRDLLEQPAVAVRITERGKRAVAATRGIRTAGPTSPEYIG